jgi:uncharacterized protein YukE
MNDDQIMNMLLIMANMTKALTKISEHMEEIVEKLDSIDSNIVHMNNMVEEDING